MLHNKPELKIFFLWAGTLLLGSLLLAAALKADIGKFTSWINKTTNAQTTCHLYSSQGNVPSGFGAWGVVFTNKLLIKAACSPASAIITVGDGDSHYIYEKGHIWRNNAWQLITFAGSDKVPRYPWYRNEASATINLSSSELSNTNYVVAYVCTWRNNSEWKCRCRDSTGANKYWHLQAFKRESSGDTTPPTISITSPINNQTVSGTITISANASDNVAVSKVAFSLKGFSCGEDITSPYSVTCNTTQVTNGTYIINATAYDTSNNQTTAQITVTVGNAPSTVGIYKHIDLRARTPHLGGAYLNLGDLNNDGKIDYLFNDGERLIRAYDHNSAFMWERYDPSISDGVPESSHKWTISIYDIDQDGQNEVIGFLKISGVHSLVILNGNTGAIKKNVSLPYPPPIDYPSDVNEGNHIVIANLRGRAFPQDIVVVKSSYIVINAYDNNLNPLWQFDSGKYSGHHAWPYDIDNDGKHEILAGDNVLDNNGKLLWTVQNGNDHTDSISVLDYHPGFSGKEILAAGETFMHTYSPTGALLKTYSAVNPQNLVPGEYDKNVFGKEIVVGSKNSRNLLTVIDKEGNILTQTNGAGEWGWQIDWDGDRTQDEYQWGESSGSMRYKIVKFNNNAITVVADLSSALGSVIYTPPQDVDPSAERWPLINADMIGDYREEVIYWDEDEIIIFENTSPLANPNAYPSPWNDLSYKMRYLSQSLYGRMYIDYQTLNQK
jgi:hypothetical protein